MHSAADPKDLQVWRELQVVPTQHGIEEFEVVRQLDQLLGVLGFIEARYREMHAPQTLQHRPKLVRGHDAVYDFATVAQDSSVRVEST